MQQRQGVCYHGEEGEELCQGDAGDSLVVDPGSGKKGSRSVYWEREIAIMDERDKLRKQFYTLRSQMEATLNDSREAMASTQDAARAEPFL